MTQPPLPQPQSDRNPITFDQYEAYTPQRLELWDGFYNYGGQDMTSFHLAILTNMGLRAAVSHVPIAKWLAAIQEVALQNPKLDDALRDRLLRAIAELMAVAKYLD
ncbi:MAG: hypothetical protein IM533_04285 [Pseudanabaena sp. M007S1SP1A06QC]|jgi:hypothetical protein|nr:hypothetical protein [Pseudanabaena sp. M109S1SP2A07QC]MCA6603700.1 hypothetical protein [Pseudanabaena sp. M007S1SP1A06QC]